MFGLFGNNSTPSASVQAAREEGQDRMLLLYAHKVSCFINNPCTYEEDLQFFISDAQMLRYYMLESGQKELTYSNYLFKVDANNLLSFREV